MSNLEDIEKRLMAAIKNLPNCGALETQNAALKAELAALKAQRKADVAELDVLLDKLKPILEEAGNA